MRVNCSSSSSTFINATHVATIFLLCQPSSTATCTRGLLVSTKHKRLVLINISILITYIKSMTLPRITLQINMTISQPLSLDWASHLIIILCFISAIYLTLETETLQEFQALNLSLLIIATQIATCTIHITLYTYASNTYGYGSD